MAYLKMVTQINEGEEKAGYSSLLYPQSTLGVSEFVKFSALLET